MSLTIAQKAINDHVERGAGDCDQKVKEFTNLILNTKVNIEEYEKTREQWRVTAVHMRNLKYQE